MSNLIRSPGDYSHLLPGLPVAESPISMIARSKPDAAVGLVDRLISLEHRKISAQQRQQETLANRSLAENMAGVCASWLHSRSPGESFVEVEFDSYASENCFFFCSGSRLRGKMTVRTG